MITEVKPIFGGDSFAISTTRDNGRTSTITLTKAQLMRLATQIDRAAIQQEIQSKTREASR